MSTKNTGGAAFPIPKDRDISDSHKNGMTLRDYFAAKALEGLISKMAFELHADHEKAKEVHKCLAQSAYSYADAMIAEREK